MQTSKLDRMGLVLLLAGSVLLVGVPGDINAADTAQAVTLTLGDYRFTPASIEVEAGTAIHLTLTNTDGITPHNFILQDTTGGLDIEASVAAGQSVTLEFTPSVPGSYVFYCSKKLPFMKSHRARGMEGTLNVTTASDK
jgi:plastocyanin